jgi:NTE family protein
MPGIGLVLGAGGEVGYAFHAGVLAALAEVTGWDARSADVIVGTSAGSIAGAVLRAGCAPADLAARVTGDPVSEDARRLLARADAANERVRPIPAKAPRAGLPTMSAPGALVRAAVRPWNARPGAVAAAALPAGRVSTEAIAAGLRELFDTWPDAPLWVNAVQLHTGRRVTFGREVAHHADVASAVAASCAIPTYFEPVEIAGARFVDGAAHSPTNADLLAGIGLDLVVVSSPMSIVGNKIRLSPDHPARTYAQYALSREVARIRKTGTPVLTFQPTADDLAVFGLNAMDASKRAGVARQARVSATARLLRSDVHDRLARLRTPTPADTVQSL